MQVLVQPGETWEQDTQEHASSFALELLGTLSSLSLAIEWLHAGLQSTTSWLHVNNAKAKLVGLHLPAEIYRPEREVEVRHWLHVGAGKSGVPGSVCIPDCTHAASCSSSGWHGWQWQEEEVHPCKLQEKDLCLFSDVNLGCGTSFGPIHSDFAGG